MAKVPTNYTAALAKATGELIRDVVAPLKARIEALEAAQAEFGYKGTFAESRVYRRGNFVTFRGALWHAERETTSRPGSSDEWRLCVKQGQHS